MRIRTRKTRQKTTKTICLTSLKRRQLMRKIYSECNTLALISEIRFTQPKSMQHKMQIRVTMDV